MTPAEAGDADLTSRAGGQASAPRPGGDEGASAGPVLTVVVPAFNEAQHIRRNLLAVEQALSGTSHELVIVDDGSHDATFEEVLGAVSGGIPAKVVRQPANRGKGAALARGFESARGELVAFLDADLEIPPVYLLRLVQVMEANGADVVVGVREDGPERAFPPARRVMSRTYRWLVSWLFGLEVSETQAGIKLFRREVLEDCVPRLTARRFAFDVELLAACKRFGYTIAECPVSVEFGRQGAMGRMTPGQVLHMIAETLGVYYRSSFWTWLRPGLSTKLWMLAMGLGIFLFGMGVAKLLTPMVLHDPLRQAFSIVALQFLPRTARDWLLVVVGLALAGSAVVQLNRSLMDAFARVDKGDLAGILQVRSDDRAQRRSPPGPDAEGDS